MAINTAFYRTVGVCPDQSGPRGTVEAPTYPLAGKPAEVARKPRLGHVPSAGLNARTGGPDGWRYAVANAPAGLLASFDAAVLEPWANCAGIYPEALAADGRDPRSGHGDEGV